MGALASSLAGHASPPFAHRAMCFSATASFVTAAALVPIGVWAVELALRREPGRSLPLAVVPFCFAAQQAIEGLVWLNLADGPPSPMLRAAALAYLGFAYAFWPVWMPWCALRLAVGRVGGARQRLMRLCWVMGCLLAGLLWIPLFRNPGLIHPIMRHGSIDYQAQFSSAVLLGHQPGSLLYLLIVCLPLFLPPGWRLRCFAVALVMAFAVSQIAYLYAFSSVWCFFSAVLSVLVVWILREQEAPQGYRLCLPEA